MTDEEIAARAICKDRNNNSDSAWAAYKGEARIAVTALSSAGRLVGEFNEDEAIAKLAYAMWDADDTDKLTRPEDNARMMKRARGVWDWYGPYVRWIAASAPHPATDATDWKALCGAAVMERNAMRDKCMGCITPAEHADALAAAQAENEKLRAALLGYIRNENGCIPDAHYPSARCTGWDAEKCGCAVEARAALTPPPLSPEKE